MQTAPTWLLAQAQWSATHARVAVVALDARSAAHHPVAPLVAQLGYAPQALHRAEASEAEVRGAPLFKYVPLLEVSSTVMGVRYVMKQ